MSDEEVICTWMGWFTGDWTGGGGLGEPARWTPTLLDLDALHEVEARLAVEQWDEYAIAMLDKGIVRNAGVGNRFAYRMLHASAADKIKALAAVLRTVVEAAHKEKVSA